MSEGLKWNAKHEIWSKNLIKGKHFQERRVSHLAHNLQYYTRMKLSNLLHTGIAEVLVDLNFVVKSGNAAQNIDIFKRSSNQKQLKMEFYVLGSVCPWTEARSFEDQFKLPWAGPENCCSNRKKFFQQNLT